MQTLNFKQHFFTPTKKQTRLFKERKSKKKDKRKVQVAELEHLCVDHKSIIEEEEEEEEEKEIEKESKKMIKMKNENYFDS